MLPLPHSCLDCKQVWWKLVFVLSLLCSFRRQRKFCRITKRVPCKHASVLSLMLSPRQLILSFYFTVWGPKCLGGFLKYHLVQKIFNSRPAVICVRLPLKLWKRSWNLWHEPVFRVITSKASFHCVIKCFKSVCESNWTNVSVIHGGILGGVSVQPFKFG